VNDSSHFEPARLTPSPGYRLLDNGTYMGKSNALNEALTNVYLKTPKAQAILSGKRVTSGETYSLTGGTWDPGNRDTLVLSAADVMIEPEQTVILKCSMISHQAFRKDQTLLLEPDEGMRSISGEEIPILFDINTVAKAGILLTNRSKAMVAFPKDPIIGKASLVDPETTRMMVTQKS